jgi:hypothetical protein
MVRFDSCRRAVKTDNWGGGLKKVPAIFLG